MASILLGLPSASLPLLIILCVHVGFTLFHIFSVLQLDIYRLYILHYIAPWNKICFHYTILLFYLYIGGKRLLHINFGMRLAPSNGVVSLEAPGHLLVPTWRKPVEQ